MLPTELLLDSSLRTGCATLLAVAYAAVCGTVFVRERRKHKSTSALTLAAADSPGWVVAYASQTGTAEQLAVETARHLHQGGLPVLLVELNQLSARQLQQTERALFIVSTCGEGDAPDNGALFSSQNMISALPLSQLHFAVLALGDDSYAHHCAFGRALDGWLRNCGARAIQPCIEINRGDETALAAWQALLTHLAGSSDAPDWTAPDFDTWRLVSRECLNPDSQGAPLYDITLLPSRGELPHWESGDLAQVKVADDDGRPREYSIASLPSEGSLRLLVRLHRNSDGQTGSTSGWFARAEIGSSIRLRLRPHRLFRLGANAERPLILIGNGSGLAGLRGHIKTRAGGGYDSWLIYGERNASHDAIWAEELIAWRQAGVLSRLDRVFSRDGKPLRYVQDVLSQSGETLRQWVANGAAIYVCGSRVGMGEGVEAALIGLLGEDTMEMLTRAGRYRRDVY